MCLSAVCCWEGSAHCKARVSLSMIIQPRLVLPLAHCYFAILYVQVLIWGAADMWRIHKYLKTSGSTTKGGKGHLRATSESRSCLISVQTQQAGYFQHPPHPQPPFSVSHSLICQCLQSSLLIPLFQSSHASMCWPALSAPAVST